MKRAILIAAVTAGLGAALFADDLKEPWVAPKYAAKKQNPIPANKDSIEAGRALFNQICFICHGQSGKGDGPGASTCLPQKPADLTNPKVWEQTDGTLFWKVSNGRGAMPKFEAILTPEQRWNAINFIRSNFGKGQQPKS